MVKVIVIALRRAVNTSHQKTASRYEAGERFFRQCTLSKKCTKLPQVKKDPRNTVNVPVISASLLTSKIIAWLRILTVLFAGPRLPALRLHHWYGIPIEIVASEGFQSLFPLKNLLDSLKNYSFVLPSISASLETWNVRLASRKRSGSERSVNSGITA